MLDLFFIYAYNRYDVFRVRKIYADVFSSKKENMKTALCN